MGGFEPTAFRSESDNTNHCATEAAHKYNMFRCITLPKRVDYVYASRLSGNYLYRRHFKMIRKVPEQLRKHPVPRYLLRHMCTSKLSPKVSETTVAVANAETPTSCTSFKCLSFAHQTLQKHEA